MLRCWEQGLPDLQASRYKTDNGGEREFGAPWKPNWRLLKSQPFTSQGPRPTGCGMFSSDAFGVINETCINELPCGLFWKLESLGSCVRKWEDLSVAKPW